MFVIITNTMSYMATITDYLKILTDGKINDFAVIKLL